RPRAIRVRLYSSRRGRTTGRTVSSILDSVSIIIYFTVPSTPPRDEQMSFREKSAWVSFILLLLMTAVWAWAVLQSANGQLEPRSMLHIAHDVLVAFLALQILLHAVIFLQAPRDARTPKDERERLIELKATRIAFFVLIVGALVSIWISHI